MKKLLALLLITLLLMMSPLAAVADNSGELINDNSFVEEDIKDSEKQIEDLEEELDEAKETDDQLDDELEEESLEELEEKEQDLDEQEEVKPWKKAKDALEKQKDEIEEQREELEDQIEELEEEYKQAKENENTELAAELIARIETLKQQKKALKQDMKQKIELMKKVMKEKYTQEELNELEDVAEELEAKLKVKVIPVTHVFVKNANVKFDTPPVIKQGRTLIPVRAISEATGAIVEWDGEEQKIIIKKDNKEIILKLNSNKIYVNEAELEIDVPAQLINNRTVVPLRFIIENLDLEVKWDGETETIEII
jgi:myosin heavy subunit